MSGFRRGVRSTSSLPFALLRPVSAAQVFKPEPDPADIIDHPHKLAHAKRLLESLRRSKSRVVVDFETKGTRAWHHDDYPVGVGAAWRNSSGEAVAIYIPLTLDWCDELVYELLTILSTKDLVAHNVLFDAQFLERLARDTWQPESGPRELVHSMGVGGTAARFPWRWKYCTYGLYMALAGEKFPGQEWGLKAAQLQLLRWRETNEEGIDEWLWERGYLKGIVRKKDEPLDEFVLRARTKRAEQDAAKRSGLKVNGWVNPDKAEMWRVPPHILGGYCILDCLSTLQLLEEVLEPALQRFPELRWFHTEMWQTELELLADQQRVGIRFNSTKGKAHRAKLQAKMADAEAKLRTPGNPLAERILALEATWLAEHDAKEPAKFKKQKERTEPPKLKKDGSVSKNWEKWNELSQLPPEPTKLWPAWAERREAILKGDIPDYRWHPSQRAQVQAMLYGTDDGKPGLMQWQDGEPPDPDWNSPGTIWVMNTKEQWVEVDRTDSGALPVDGDLISLLPKSYGEPLGAYLDAQKELGYLEAFLELAQYDGRVHAGWRAPGTVTFRLAGKEPNFQQVPKSLELLDCFELDPGTAWAEADATALEPHVLAELSRDPSLMELYGPEAKPHDLYLYNAKDYAVLGDNVRKHYPDGSPGNEVTKERVAAAKAACKEQRGPAKTVTLASNYGAGWRKIFRTLRIEGVDITEGDAKAIVESHRRKYRVSGEDFTEILTAEWNKRGGWIMSGLGHPVCIAEGFLKDVVNRLIQRTAHDVHCAGLYFLRAALKRHGIPAVGVIWDFHDQYIFQVPEAFAARTMQACKEAADELNSWLDGVVRIKYGPRIVMGGLGEAKDEEGYEKREKERKMASH